MATTIIWSATQCCPHHLRCYTDYRLQRNCRINFYFSSVKLRGLRVSDIDIENFTSRERRDLDRWAYWFMNVISLSIIHNLFNALSTFHVHLYPLLCHLLVNIQRQLELKIWAFLGPRLEGLVGGRITDGPLHDETKLLAQVTQHKIGSCCFCGWVLGEPPRAISTLRYKKM